MSDELMPVRQAFPVGSLQGTSEQTRQPVHRGRAFVLAAAELLRGLVTIKSEPPTPTTPGQFADFVRCLNQMGFENPEPVAISSQTRRYFPALPDAHATDVLHFRHQQAVGDTLPQIISVVTYGPVRRGPQHTSPTLSAPAHIQVGRHVQIKGVWQTQFIALPTLLGHDATDVRDSLFNTPERRSKLNKLFKPGGQRIG